MRRVIAHINFFVRFFYCILFLRDSVVFRGYNISKMYAVLMISNLRRFKMRRKRLFEEEKMHAPKSVIVNELKLIIQAIRELVKYRYLYCLSLRWK